MACSLLAHEPAVLTDQPAVLAHQPAVLAHIPAVLAHQPRILPDQPKVLAHQPRYARLPAPLMHRMGWLVSGSCKTFLSPAGERTALVAAFKRTILLTMDV